MSMETKIPTYRCTVGNMDDTGIFAVSFVEYPAIESNFIALKKPAKVKLTVDKQKQLLTGALLIPDQLIYRNDNRFGEYYITYTRDEIEKIALKMMKGREPLGKTTHQHEKSLKGNYLAELWIVQDPKRDKAVSLGLGELPAGTLVVTYKVEDARYWREEVLGGKVKGFSLEGIFNFKNVHTMSKKTKNVKKEESKVPTFFKALATFLEGDTEAAAEAVADEAKKDETDSGTPYLIFELAEGGEVYVDEAGFCTLDGEQMAPGEHALADGNVIVVDDSGMLVITQPEAKGAAPTEADVAAAKQRAKSFLKAQNPNAAEIAKLKKKIEELEKQPSTEKAKPDVEASKKEEGEMTHTEKMAAVLKSRRERMDNKKNKK